MRVLKWDLNGQCENLVSNSDLKKTRIKFNYLKECARESEICTSFLSHEVGFGRVLPILFAFFFCGFEFHSAPRVFVGFNPSP